MRGAQQFKSGVPERGGPLDRRDGLERSAAGGVGEGGGDSGRGRKEM